MDFNFLIFFVALGLALFLLGLGTYGWLRGIFFFSGGVLFVVLAATISHESITYNVLFNNTDLLPVAMTTGIDTSGIFIIFMALGIVGMYAGADI